MGLEPLLSDVSASRDGLEDDTADAYMYHTVLPCDLLSSAAVAVLHRQRRRPDLFTGKKSIAADPAKSPFSLLL